MEFPGGSDNYLAITGAAHPFLTGAETFHTPSLGDEEFELPPIALEPDPEVVAHLEDLGEPPPGPSPFPPPPQPHPPHGAPYGVGAALELPVAMMEPLELEPFSAPPPVTIDVPIGSLSPGGLLGPAHLTTIDQSELSSQLGLSLGGAGPAGAGPAGAPPTLATPPAAPSPERQLSPPPSPPGTPPDELAAAPKPSPPSLPAPPAPAPPPKKPAKKPKKKKDPNEPQKPVSAYALFFRDTQAAIKGQNPNATFGEVSKIVASMWDSLGEEQKQVYKRKTEAAKQEYLRALEAYRAVQTSAEPPDPDPAPPPASPDPPPPPPPPITKILISKQILSPSLTVSSPGGVVTVIPATVVTARGGGGAPQIVTRSLLQPPPLQQMPPPPQQPPAQVTVLQPPPPLQAMQTPPPAPAAPPKIHQPPPPPLHIKILPPPPLQIQPLRLEVAPGGPGDAGTPPATPQNGDGAAEHVDMVAGDVVPEVESPPPMAVELVESPPRPRCVRLGCDNAPVASADWDEEYCSSECLVKHCRDVFLAWLAARNAVVFVK
ncbi:TOX high mobility group box family member 4 [Caloenas nicobarica]|uniref:TOX high mobility group box family member 4 n=1 Tax=Caloenas nicobarica TaxID=187106 RepID=UPI0032B800EB